MTEALDQNNELLVGFIEESVNSIIDLPSSLKDYLDDAENAEAINSVFRSVHSIKGNAGFFGLTSIKKFSHSIENTLDDVRNNNLSLSDDLYRGLVKGFDTLDDLLRQAAEGELSDELRDEDLQLLKEIDEYSENSVTTDNSSINIEALNNLADQMAESGDAQALDWAAKLIEIIDEGREKTQELSEDSEIPSPHKMLQRQFYIAKDCVITDQVIPLLTHFDRALRTDSSISDDHSSQINEDIERLLGSVKISDDKNLASTVEKARKNYQAILNSPLSVDATLISVIWETLYPVLEELSQSPVSTQNEQEQKSTDISAKGVENASASLTKKERMIRINEGRLENFMDEVSNLFITCERFKDVQQRLSNRIKADTLIEELRQVTLTLSSQTNGLQKSVAVLRKVPIRGLFSKFPKMARSLAEGLGKKVEVHLEGEATEVDKSIIEDLDAPLCHMIRNVADHAIETPPERETRGVDEIGNLWLSASTTRSHVVITIKDDGRGINAESLKKKAIEKGVISQQQAELLSEQEAVELIFHPGFSTAEEVTDISGRGVGMDVVRTTIRDYDGEIHVQSEVNVGTTFTIELPIRQAVLVLDGLLLEQNNDKYVIPFENIVEVLEIEPEDINSCQGESIISLRGENYSAYSLASLLGMSDQQQFEESANKTRNAILISSKAGDICLFVDEILSKRKVVINSLQDILPGLNRVSGVAQLGGGELALVLNAQGIIKSFHSYSAIS